MGRRFLFFLSLYIYSSISLGACSDSFIADARRVLGYADERNERSEFVACKKLPYSQDQSLIAIAKRQKGTEIGDSETMGNYNLDIALINDRTKAVLRRSFFRKRFMSTGYRFDGIKIDMANYTVAPNLRAIGIRANYHIDLGFTSSQSLSLYIPSGRTFMEILSDADMHIIYTKNWPSCQNETREATRTLAITEQITQGYFDLLVTETLVDTQEYESEKHSDNVNPCDSKVEHQETKKYILRFNGRRYGVPIEMRMFDCRIC